MKNNAVKLHETHLITIKLVFHHNNNHKFVNKSVYQSFMSQFHIIYVFSRPMVGPGLDPWIS